MKDEVKQERHPSFGLLEISRITGHPGSLFGSSIEHSQFVRIRVKRAVANRDLYRHWYQDDHCPDLVEIDLSMAQFAEAITSLNHGCGTPCTIRRVNGEDMPEPTHKNIREEFRDEFKEKMRKLTSGIKEMAVGVRKLLDEKKSLTKADRKSIVSVFDRLIMELGANVPFVHESFDEAVDKTVAAAKAEVEAFMTNAVMNAGYKALQASGEAPRLLSLEKREQEAQDVMPKIDGVHFRCDCGCNVFRWTDTERGRRLSCNSCSALYEAEE